MIVQSYVKQGQGSIRSYYNCQLGIICGIVCGMISKVDSLLSIRLAKVDSLLSVLIRLAIFILMI